MRIKACLMMIAVAVTGCSSDPQTSNVVKDFLSGPQIPEPTAEFIALAEAGAPAYVLSVEEREGAFSSLFRQTVNKQGEETWISGDKLSVGMKQGMIIATRGLGGDMLAGDSSQTLAAIKAGREGNTLRFITHLNGNNEAHTLSFRCRLSKTTRQPLDLGAYSVDTVLVSEACTNGDIQFTNLFWVEQGRNRIMQSRQWISDHLGTLALRVIPR
jgi:hypothetical protein